MKLIRKTVISIVFFLLLSPFTKAAIVDTLKVYSKAMKKEVPNLIVVPDSYTLDGDQSYPSVYVLHGAGGDYTNWTNKGKIQSLADQLQMVFILPDGGTTSWYFDSSIDPTYQYETFVTKELIKEVDNQFRTIKSRSKRAICGLSMGGHGAMFLAMRHQDKFGAAGSMSGGVDFRPFPENWDIKKRLGTYEENETQWDKNTAINQIHLLEENHLRMIIDCGIDDFFYEVNMQFHEKLVENKIPHDFTIRPGKHNWNYWSNSIKYQLLFFNEYFAEAERLR